MPYDPPDLEIKDKTFGLVAPEEYSLPPTAPLWTPVAYAAFDVAMDADKAKTEKEKKVSLYFIKKYHACVNFKITTHLSYVCFFLNLEAAKR